MTTEKEGTDRETHDPEYRNGQGQFERTRTPKGRAGNGQGTGRERGTDRDTHNSEFPYPRTTSFPTDITPCCAHAPCMAQPRSQLVSPGSDGLYHCVQRCVRRAFLCGIDRYTGQSFEHRKAWVEDRLGLLAECFAVSIHAYAVMSNHLHLVVQLAPDAVAGWSDEEVAARWVRLFPPRQDSDAAVDAKCMRLPNICRCFAPGCRICPG